MRSGTLIALVLAACGGPAPVPAVDAGPAPPRFAPRTLELSIADPPTIAGALGSVGSVADERLLRRIVTSRCGVTTWSPAEEEPLADPIVSVGGGEELVCVVTADGDLICSGGDELRRCGRDRACVRRVVESDRGQAFDLVWEASGCPGPERPLTGVARVAVHGRRACALGQDGSVVCWGRRSAIDWSPVPNDCTVHPIRTVDGEPLRLALARVGVGIDDAGGLWVWSDPDSPTPGVEPYVARRVELDFPVVDVAVAGGGVCVLSRDGEVSCWLAIGPARASLVASKLEPVVSGARLLACDGVELTRSGCAIVIGEKLAMYTPPHRAVPEVWGTARVGPVVELATFFNGDFACVRAPDGAVHCGTPSRDPTDRGRRRPLVWIDARGEDQLGDRSPCDGREL